MDKLKLYFKVITLLIFTLYFFCFALGNFRKSNIDKLSQINTYQEQYFKIIKRNDILLQINRSAEFDRDLKELSELYKLVESQISPKCEFLKEYKEINQQYAYNTGETTVEMNDFAQEHYNAVDKLLNDTYKAVKLKIPKEEFDKLVLSEINWLKEVENYRDVFEQQGFGTIGGLIYLNYQIDMRNFRTLLLMLYF